ncbi:hypothetical protein KIPB_000432 [Kipferlia bialata]|uniref:Uncharacterized protein n=1 Tax=Kipferlia bialata TaxID=797122 RepID=A0A9K3GDG6_9EUKA|nr:hypothetical protein KIPB_000432 [Kipferlia bialata]|eukprot:g432.t1
MTSRIPAFSAIMYLKPRIIHYVAHSPAHRHEILSNSLDAIRVRKKERRMVIDRNTRSAIEREEDVTRDLYQVVFPVSKLDPIVAILALDKDYGSSGYPHVPVYETADLATAKTVLRLIVEGQDDDWVADTKGMGATASQDHLDIGPVYNPFSSPSASYAVRTSRGAGGEKGPLQLSSLNSEREREGERGDDSADYYAATPQEKERIEEERERDYYQLGGAIAVQVRIANLCVSMADGTQRVVKLGR